MKKCKCTKAPLGDDSLEGYVLNTEYPFRIIETCAGDTLWDVFFDETSDYASAMTYHVFRKY